MPAIPWCWSRSIRHHRRRRQCRRRPGYYGLAHLGRAYHIQKVHFVAVHGISSTAWRLSGRTQRLYPKEETTVYTIFPQGNAAKGLSNWWPTWLINSQFPANEARQGTRGRNRRNQFIPRYSVRGCLRRFRRYGVRRHSRGAQHPGSADSVAALGSDDCREFLRRHYTVANSVVFSPAPSTRAYRAPWSHGILPPCPPVLKELASRTVSATRTAREIIDGLHQSHVILGMEIDSLYGAGRYADGLSPT